jgi:Fur family transcriptional regulator, ferric uptake regulator
MATRSANGVPASPESVLNRLRGRGLRISTPRRLVVQTLFAAQRPLTANELASGLNGGADRLDLATVYRNLETLQELGVVVRLAATDGPARWRLVGDDEGGYLACHRCGALEEVAAAELDELRGLMRERYGYELSFTRFPLIGVCPSCGG